MRNKHKLQNKLAGIVYWCTHYIYIIHQEGYKPGTGSPRSKEQILKSRERIWIRGTEIYQKQLFQDLQANVRKLLEKNYELFI